jgi:hypothetical protein
METQNTLGIIVNSNRYFDQVTHLADAAIRNKKIVRMLLLGQGLAYIHTTAYNRLRNAVRISLCSISSRQYISQHIDLTDKSIPVVHPMELSKILKECYRYVVF